MEQEKKEPTEEEIRESRKKFAQMYGQTQIGGKGTEKRKKPVKHRGNKVEVDKKIEAVAKKSQARKLNEVVEVNTFPDISNWDTRNVANMSFMFEGCDKKLVPKKFK